MVKECLIVQKLAKIVHIFHMKKNWIIYLYIYKLRNMIIFSKLFFNIEKEELYLHSTLLNM